MRLGEANRTKRSSYFCPSFLRTLFAPYFLSPRTKYNLYNAVKRRKADEIEYKGADGKQLICHYDDPGVKLRDPTR